MDGPKRNEVKIAAGSRIGSEKFFCLKKKMHKLNSKAMPEKKVRIARVVLYV